MIDLNPHSSSTPTGHRHRTPSQEVNRLIDEGLQRRRDQEPASRGYVGMSQIGDVCSRRVFYDVEGSPKTRPEGKRLRALDVSSLYEPIVAGWLMDAGFELQVTDPLTGDQFEVSDLDGAIQGHFDGKLLSGPAINGLVYPALWENKALEGKYWRQLSKQGLRAYQWGETYWAQANLYIIYGKFCSGLFTAINKDNADIYVEIIPSDCDWLRFVQRSRDIVAALDAGMPPPRICPNPFWHEAKMCDFAEFCWKDTR